MSFLILGKSIIKETWLLDFIKVTNIHQYYVAQKVHSFVNFNMCLFPKILSIMYGGVHFQECYV